MCQNGTRRVGQPLDSGRMLGVLDACKNRAKRRRNGASPSERTRRTRQGGLATTAGSGIASWRMPHPGYFHMDTASETSARAMNWMLGTNPE